MKAIYDELLASQPENPENLRNIARSKTPSDACEASKGYPQALIHYQRARTMDEKRVALRDGSCRPTRSRHRPVERSERAVETGGLAGG